MATIDIARLIPAAHSIALVGENVRVLKKKKKTSKDMLKLGVTNIVGTSLIQAESRMVELLD